MSDLRSYWAPFFDLMGSPDRLHIMFMLHGSEYIEHHTEETIRFDDVSCLKTSVIAEGIGKETSINYHLNKLEGEGLIRRIPAIENGQAVILWGVTEKWLTFARDFNIDEKVRKYLKAKYPERYIAE